jgi:tetratricopeptide (TPR) repeat protein
MASSPCLFLSHSGADIDAARELKRRILESPEAKAAGLSVWFDKDDLSAGVGWQEQVEAAITQKASTFAVYVGSKGVINWVEREVRLGLARATGANAIPFVPILAPALGDPTAALPPFAQQHQSVFDPLHRPEEMAKLLAAILGSAKGKVRLTDEPFVGLRAMTEREADRFFGRDAEVAELVEDLRRNRIVAIVADSGAGKSSLAMAGLAPAYRGGALADPARREPDERIWHVLVMRPGADPLEGLRRGVTQAAERMGVSPDARAALRKRLTFEDASEAAYALRCDLPANATETLLIVDQFDELLTQTPESDRAPFIEFLLKLAAMPEPGGFRVVLTVRVDYFNLCRPYGGLYDALQKEGGVARLKRITDAGLQQAVREPLRMAGFPDEREENALARQMRRDLSERPGDLALAQMALWTVWRSRAQHGGSLLKAYVDVGGVSGALAQEAERVRELKLNDAERALLLALLARLVRLGETGGVLRRAADVGEFDPARLALAQKLASDDYGRLLLVGEGPSTGAAKIEVCHEQLITQWPWLQNTLNAAAADLRALERLTDRAQRWQGARKSERAEYLATGAEREQFGKLKKGRDEWLSGAERDFVRASDAAFARAEWTKRTLILGLIAFAGIAASEWLAAVQAEQEANAQRAKAQQALELATRTANELVFDLAQKFKNVTGVPKAVVRDVLDRALKLQEELQRGGEASDDLKRSEAAALDETASVRLATGDTQGALDAARKSLLLIEALSAAHPENTDYRRHLSVSYEKVGEVLRAQGELAGAMEAYRKELSIAQELSAAGPGNAEWGSDLPRSYSKVGDVLIAQGDRPGALKAYRDGLAIIEKLVATDPGNPEWHYGLGILHERIGSVLIASGDLRAALQEFVAKRDIVSKLTTSDPGNALWRRDLSVAYSKVGDVLAAQGDAAGALNAYRDGLAIIERLSAADPGNAQWQRDLASSNERIGDSAIRGGDEAGAKAAFQNALKAYEALLKLHPDDAQARLFSVVPHWRLAALEQEKSREKARAHLQAALAILEPLGAAGHLDADRRGWIADIKAQLSALDAPAAKPPAAPPARRNK